MEHSPVQPPVADTSPTHIPSVSNQQQPCCSSSDSADEANYKFETPKMSTTLEETTHKTPPCSTGQPVGAHVTNATTVQPPVPKPQPTTFSSPNETQLARQTVHSTIHTHPTTKSPGTGSSNDQTSDPRTSPVSRKPGRVKWDEATIAKHMSDRGVLYGTMKIDQPDTPYLYYDRKNPESTIVNEFVKYRDSDNNLQHTLNPVTINELQERLGLLAKEQGEGKDITAEKQIHAAAAFKAKRDNFYKSESLMFKSGKET